MTGRVASFGQTTYITNQILRLESNYSDLTTQSSSGLKSQTFSGISGDAQKLLNLESQASSINTQTTNAQNTTYKLNAISGALTNVSSIITAVRTNISSTISIISSSGSGGASEQSELQAYMSELVGAMNTEFGGKYLFGGSANDSAPVDPTNPNYTGLTAGTPNTSYYKGNSDIQSVQLNDSLNVSYGITADNSGFEQALRAISLAISNPTDGTTLGHAFDLLSKASDSVASLSSVNATNQQLLTSQISVNQSTLSYLNTNITNITDADLTTISEKLSNEKTQLDASYGSLSDMLKLRLSDYLK